MDKMLYPTAATACHKKWPVLAAALCVMALTPAWAADPVLVATKVKGAEALSDPNGAYWKNAKAVDVVLEAQTAVTPTQPNPAVTSVRVKAVQSDTWLGLLLEWKDSTQSDRLVTDQFGDQVAVELPVQFKKEDLPNIMMGHQGNPVSVWQWRAAMQHDIEKGAPTTKSLYPNSHYDLYPDQVLPPETAKLYAGAAGLGNPVSVGKGTPVLEQVAEGFGSITDVGAQRKVVGHGEWKNGAWRVALSYPLSSDAAVPLAPGGETALGFAVWDGGHQEVGSRKSWSSQWVALQLAK